MNEHRRKDRKAAIFLGIVVLLSVLAVFSSGEGHSFRSGGGLVFGPAAIGYALYGLSKGSFPEMSQSNRETGATQFWFVFGVFLVAGICVLGVGIRSITTGP